MVWDVVPKLCRKLRFLVFYCICICLYLFFLFCSYPHLSLFRYFYGKRNANLKIFFGELVVVFSALVDDLRHSDDLSVVVADRHAHQRVRLVPGLAVDLTVEAGILKNENMFKK